MSVLTSKSDSVRVEAIKRLAFGLVWGTLAVFVIIPIWLLIGLIYAAIDIPWSVLAGRDRTPLIRVFWRTFFRTKTYLDRNIGYVVSSHPQPKVIP